MSLLASFAFAASLGAMAPQEAGLAQEPTRVEDIEVNARLREELVRAQVANFIDSNMSAPPGRPLARWNKPVCIATAYLNPQYGQAIIDRIATRVIEFGGDVEGPGCKVNVMVVGTNDGAATARALVQDDPTGFTPSLSSTNLSTRALRKFQNSEDAVRWWHVSLPVMMDTEEIAVRLKGEEPRFVTTYDASRLRTSTRDDLMRVVIIVDFTKTENIQMGALVDYISFIAMTQVSARHEATGFDSILNLFNDPQNVTGLTEWDRDYLSALYRAAPNRPNIRRQIAELATEVLVERDSR